MSLRAGRKAPLGVAVSTVLLVLCTGLGTAAAQGQTTPSTFSVDSPAPVVEGTGTGNGGTVRFTIRLSPAATVPTRIRYQTSNGTATSPADFARIDLTIATFAPGETEKVVTVALEPDDADETDHSPTLQDPESENFELQLSKPPLATGETDDGSVIGDARAVGTILDDDGPPALSVTDKAETEGTGANRVMVFTVSLDRPSGKQVSVDYETTPGTAAFTSTGPNSTPEGDFTRTDGTLIFSPGLTSQTVSVFLRADQVDEVDETFTLKLKPDPLNATIARGTATGTIRDDDGPNINIADVALPAEGGAGDTSTARFLVSLDAPSPQPVTVTYATANDSASAPDDYLPAPAASTVTIPAGQTTGEITVGVVGDDLDENEEKFRVTLSGAVNGTLKDAIGVATIPNDDPVPRLTVGDAVIAEGTGGTRVVTLTATLSAASGRPILAGYATRERTDVPAVNRATPDTDFQSATELVTFNAGERTKTISIPIAPDSVIEEDESFQVFVFNAASGADGVTPVTVTIVDDDLNEGNRPRLSVNDVTVLEGDAGTTVARFTVAMDRPLPRRVAVSYATANGTAAAPAEYTAIAGRLDFGPGETRKVVEVPVAGDRRLEYGQDYRLRLADAVNAGIADASGLGTITDDDVGGGAVVVGGRSVKAIDLLCRRATSARAKAPACAGIPISWDLASAGVVRVRVTALFAKARGAKAARKPIELLRQQLRVARTGKGTGRARRVQGKSTSALLTRIRKAKPARVRVEVVFENRFGGQDQPVTKELTLRL